MATRGRAPVPFFGGKSVLAPRIVALFPPHDTYVEPYCGSGACFFTKAPAPLSVLNDADGAIVNFFRVLRDPIKGARLREALELTPYAREEWAECRVGMKAVERGWDSAADDVELARRWFVLTQQSFAGRITGGRGAGADPKHRTPGWRFTTKARDHNPASSFRSAIARLPAFTTQLATAQIEHDDALAIITRYDSPRALMYCLAPETPVRTVDERFISASEVKKGDMLWPGRVVKQAWSRQHDGDLLALRVQGMPDIIRVTPEHRFMRIRKRAGKRQETRSDEAMWQQREVVEAQQLELGDYLLAPLGGIEAEPSWQWADTRYKNGKRRADLTFTPCPELYRFLGYFAAEGHIQRQDGRPVGVMLSFCKDETETWVQDAVRCCERVFGITPRVANRPTPNVMQVQINSTTIAEFVERFVPGKQPVRSLHPCLLTAPHAMQLEILRGWVRGEGGFESLARNRSKLTSTSSSETLARQMFLIAMRCGMRPSFKRRTSHFDVYFASEDIARLGWEVCAERFRSTRRIIHNHLLVRVRGIEREPYSGLVYDLDVDGDDLYGVPYVLSHNCDPPYLPDTRRGGGYGQEMSRDDHERLLDVITAPTLRSMIVLSGYDSALYRERLERAGGWQRLEVTVLCSAAGRTRASGLQGERSVSRAQQTRTEILWLNPAAQARQGLWAGLHDTSDDESDNDESTTAIPTPTTVKGKTPTPPRAAKARTAEREQRPDEP